MVSNRENTLWVILVFCLIGALAFSFQRYRFQVLVQATGERLMTIAINSVDEFDPDDLDQLHFSRDMKTEAYQRVFRTLNAIRSRNPEIKYAFVYRAGKNGTICEFIADADSNYSLPYLWIDADHSGSLGNGDVNVYPGQQCTESTGSLGQAEKIGKAGFGQNVDQWGHFITGIAPIYDREDQLVGFLGLDVDISAIN